MRRAGADFEPGSKIGEMSAPASVDGAIVVIPVLPRAYIRVGEMETGPIVFRQIALRLIAHPMGVTNTPINKYQRPYTP